MQIKREIWRKRPELLHQVAIDQLMEEYKAKGYEASIDYPIGQGFTTDLFLKKNGSGIAVQIKTGKYDDVQRQKLRAVHQFAKENDYEFTVVIAGAPHEKKIDLPELKSIFNDYFTNNTIEGLIHLAEKVVLIQVNYIEADELKLIKNADIQVIGTGDIDVELIGKDYFTESFPFDFEIILEKKNDKLALKEVLKLEFNTDDF